MAAPNIQYGLRWSIEMVALPLGAGPMGVPEMQRIKCTQASASGGGIISITSTGAFPGSTDVATACATAGTNMAAALNNSASTVVWQGWNAGGG